MKKIFYTYRITNLEENKHYIGSRGTILRPEDDLGKIYFSSSSDINFIRLQKTTPNIFKYKIIRKFNSHKNCLKFEMRLHKKFRVDISENFYNRAIQTSEKFTTINNVNPSRNDVHDFYHKDGRVVRMSAYHMQKKYGKNIYRLWKDLKTAYGWSLSREQRPRTSKFPVSTTIIHLVHDNGENFIGTVTEFCKKFNIKYTACRLLILGFDSSWRGWMYKKTYDYKKSAGLRENKITRTPRKKIISEKKLEIHRFKNIITGDVFESSIQELVARGYSSHSLRQLIYGTAHTHRDICLEKKDMSKVQNKLLGQTRGKFSSNHDKTLHRILDKRNNILYIGYRRQFIENFEEFNDCLFSMLLSDNIKFVDRFCKPENVNSNTKTDWTVYNFSKDGSSIFIGTISEFSTSINNSIKKTALYGIIQGKKSKTGITATKVVRELMEINL